MSPVQSALTKAGISVAAVVILLLRFRRSDHESAWFGISWPAALPTLAFVAVYLAWMFASDLAIGWRGPWDFSSWRQAPLIASILRVLAVGLFGPAAEELLFRGVIFSWLNERLPVALVIIATAVGWALLHWSYSWAVIAVIVVDGILLGIARWRTSSIVPPIIMHILYNLYAIW